MPRKRKATETQKTATIEIDGQYFNVPTVIEGLVYPPAEAIPIAIARGALIGPFKSEKEAVEASKSTSRSLSGPRGGPGSSEIGKEAQRIERMTAPTPFTGFGRR